MMFSDPLSTTPRTDSVRTTTHRSSAPKPLDIVLPSNETPYPTPTAPRSILSHSPLTVPVNLLSTHLCGRQPPYRTSTPLRDPTPSNPPPSSTPELEVPRWTISSRLPLPTDPDSVPFGPRALRLTLVRDGTCGTLGPGGL